MIDMALRDLLALIRNVSVVTSANLWVWILPEAFIARAATYHLPFSNTSTV